MKEIIILKNLVYLVFMFVIICIIGTIIYIIFQPIKKLPNNYIISNATTTDININL